MTPTEAVARALIARRGCGWWDTPDNTQYGYDLCQTALADAPFLLEAAERVAWQDICTCPKDGSKHLLYWPSQNAVRIGWWNDDRYAKKPRPFWDSDLQIGNYWRRKNPPSLWRRIPIPHQTLTP